MELLLCLVLLFLLRGCLMVFRWFLDVFLCFVEFCTRGFSLGCLDSLKYTSKKHGTFVTPGSD